jgi:copper chaperone
MNSTLQRTTLAVDGMTCSSCVRHVEVALRKIAGVRGIDVSVADGTVRVEHDPEQASVEAMREALAEAGYESQARVPAEVRP